MRSTLFRFAIAGLASLVMGTSAGAETILQFTQKSPSDIVTANDVGSVTTLTTAAPGFDGSIPVTIGNIGNVQLPPVPVLSGFETFTNLAGTPGSGLTTSGTAVLANGIISQTISGRIVISELVGGGGINYLTATFTGTLFGPQNTKAPTLSADSTVAGQSVTFTSTDPRVIPFLPGAFGRNFSLSFSNLAPAGLTITAAGTIDGFTGQNTGTFATAVPEPASVVMTSTAVLAGLGLFGLRRFKASKA